MSHDFSIFSMLFFIETFIYGGLTTVLVLSDNQSLSEDGERWLTRDTFEQLEVSHVVYPDMDLQCEALKIAKLVYNSNNYGLWYL